MIGEPAHNITAIIIKIMMIFNGDNGKQHADDSSFHQKQLNIFNWQKWLLFLVASSETFAMARLVSTVRMRIIIREVETKKSFLQKRRNLLYLLKEQKFLLAKCYLERFTCGQFAIKERPVAPDFVCFRPSNRLMLQPFEWVNHFGAQSSGLCKLGSSRLA